MSLYIHVKNYLLMPIHTEHPEFEQWHARWNWIEDQLLSISERGSYLVSEHAIELFSDMQLAYCAGAWISVIIVSIAIIDAQLRETEAIDNKIGTAKLLSTYYTDENIDWLRQLRNKYVHHNIDHTEDASDWYSYDQLEEYATRAIQMTIHAFFQSPGT